MMYISFWQMIGIGYLAILSLGTYTPKVRVPSIFAMAGHPPNRTTPFNAPDTSCSRVTLGRTLRLVYTSEGPEVQHTAFEGFMAYCMKVYGREGTLHGLDARIGPKPIMLVRGDFHYALYDVDVEYAVTWKTAIGVLGLVEYCFQRGFVEEFVADVETGNGDAGRLAKVALFRKRPPIADA